MKVASKFFKVSAVNPGALVQKYKNHKQHPHSQKTAVFVLAGEGFSLPLRQISKTGCLNLCSTCSTEAEIIPMNLIRVMPA